MVKKEHMERQKVANELRTMEVCKLKLVFSVQWWNTTLTGHSSEFQCFNCSLSLILALVYPNGLERSQA